MKRNTITRMPCSDVFSRNSIVDEKRLNRLPQSAKEKQRQAVYDRAAALVFPQKTRTPIPKQLLLRMHHRTFLPTMVPCPANLAAQSTHYSL